MSKDFKGGMDALLSGPVQAKSKKREKKEEKSDHSQLVFPLDVKSHETRATFIIKEDQLEAIRALAYWGRSSIKDILSDALDNLILSKKKDLSKAMVAYKNSSRST